MSSEELRCQFYRGWKFPQKLVVFIKEECVLVKLPRGQSDLEMVVVEHEKFVVVLRFRESRRLALSSNSTSSNSLTLSSSIVKSSGGAEETRTPDFLRGKSGGFDSMFTSIRFSST